MNTETENVAYIVLHDAMTGGPVRLAINDIASFRSAPVDKRPARISVDRFSQPVTYFLRETLAEFLMMIGIPPSDEDFAFSKDHASSGIELPPPGFVPARSHSI